jgi:hypothetical protein
MKSGMSVVPCMERRFVTPAPTEAAAKRSVRVMANDVMYPPYDQPMMPSRLGSARPRSMTWSTPLKMSDSGPSPQFSMLA